MDPISEALPEKVEVRADDLRLVLLTHLMRARLNTWYPDRETQLAVNKAIGYLRLDPFAETHIVDAETVWWLEYSAGAQSLYEMDECASETYDHPAVKAELNLMALGYKAPKTHEKLSALTHARVVEMMEQYHQEARELAAPYLRAKAS